MLSKEAQNVSKIQQIDFNRQDPQYAITYEFCAGILDKKHLSAKEHARMELLEECGFAVDIDSIESVTSYRTGVGIAGAFQELFYVEVTNEMRTATGGGNLSEQECEFRKIVLFLIVFFSLLSNPCRGDSSGSIVCILI